MLEFTTSDRGTVRYEVDGSGSGPWLVLLHGGYGSPTDWQLLADRYASGGYRCLRPTLRPHLGTTTPSGAPPLSVARVALDVAELCDKLDIGTAHLAGWSFGGVVAQDLVRQRPGLVATLALYNSFATYREGTAISSAVTRWGLRHASRLPRSVRALGTEATLRKFVGDRAVAQSPRQAEAFRQTARAHLEVPAVAAIMASLFDYDGLPAARRITVPTLIVTSRRDHVPMRLSEQLHQVIEGSVLDVRDGTHAVIFDEPDYVSARYLTFLPNASSQRNS